MTTASELMNFRRQATGIQTAISRMQPLVERARLLSANAEITSAHLGSVGDPLGIIARELVVIVGELRKLVAELEPVFHDVARITADWIKAEHRSERYGKLLQRMVQSSEPAEPSGETVVAVGYRALQPGLEKRWRQQQAEFRTGSPVHLVWESVIGSRRDMLRSVGNIVHMTNRMAQYVERIGWIAVRQSRFTAIAARTEAAKISAGNVEVGEVAEDIYRLADEISAQEEVLRSRIMDLQRMAATVSKPVTAEIQAQRAEARA